MQFPSPLAPGVLVSRYKRFFADVALEIARSRGACRQAASS